MVAAALLFGAIAAAGTWAIANRPDGLLHVTVLNTGSSTAVLVRTGQGLVALVDGGSSPTLLVAALGRIMPPAANHLDLVVLTGGDEAAVNGLKGLTGHYSVGDVVIPGGLGSGAQAVVNLIEATGANVVDSNGDAWAFGGATWQCLGFTALATGAHMCALTVRDRTGRALVLGGTGTADQEDLCAVFGRLLRANLVVTPPGGALSAVLLATAHPREIAVPIASGVPAAPAPAGYSTDRTASDGDLSYAGSASGLVASA